MQRAEIEAWLEREDLGGEDALDALDEITEQFALRRGWCYDSLEEFGAKFSYIQATVLQHHKLFKGNPWLKSLQLYIIREPMSLKEGLQPLMNLGGGVYGIRVLVFWNFVAKGGNRMANEGVGCSLMKISTTPGTIWDINSFTLSDFGAIAEFKRKVGEQYVSGQAGNYADFALQFENHEIQLRPGDKDLVFRLYDKAGYPAMGVEIPLEDVFTYHPSKKDIDHYMERVFTDNACGVRRETRKQAGTGGRRTSTTTGPRQWVLVRELPEGDT